MNRSELQIRIDELADEFLELRRDGKNPSIHDFTQANPDIAIPLRDFLKTILMVDNFKDETEDRLSGDFTKSDDQSFPQINDYEIVREIGRGGMGVVYEAQQLSLARTVALKVLPPGLFHNPNVLRRFQLEAKSAARLHHSNIVPIYDVGLDQEHCYYAMQFIDGQSLDYVITSLKAINEGMQPDDSELSETVKMGLSSTNVGTQPFFRNAASVCQRAAEALHYAHENGMVHRDVKPANLMLDLSGTVWVTDFGLVKTEESDLTQTGEVVGTLRYMSPERFSGQCDGRSDVYSLGMTLYEVLSQQPAFGDTQRLSLIEAIRSENPESLRRLDNRIPRDLETIVEKAIEKDPHRRYATAGEMAADLGRFTSGQPIQARRVGNTEKLWLWAKKRKALAASLAAFAALLALTATGSIIAAYYYSNLADKNLSLAKSNADKTEEANVSRQEALDKAKTSDEMLSIFTSSFESANFKTGSNYQMTAKEVLLKARDELKRSDLEDSARANMLWSLSTTFVGIGEFEQAIEPAKECYELTKKQFGPEDSKTLRAMTNLATSYFQGGRLDESLELREKALAHKRTVIGEDHPDTLIAKTNLAASYKSAYRMDESLKLQREVLAARQRINGNEDHETISAMKAVARSLSSIGKLDEAFELAEKALSLSKEHIGPEHPETIEATSTLGACLSEAGRYTEAIKVRREAVALSRKILGPEHPYTVSRINMLASSLRKTRHYQEAIKLLEEIIPLSKKQRGENHPETLIMMTNLGRSLSDLGRLDEAVKLQEETLTLKKEFIGPEHPNTFQAMANLAISYEKTRRFEEAHELRVKTLELTRKVMGEEHPHTLFAIGKLATSHFRAGNKEQAFELAQKRLESSKRVLGAEHRDTLRSMTSLAVFSARDGRMQDAVDLQEEVIEISKKEFGSEDEMTLLSMANLASGYVSLGRNEEATKLQEDVLSIRKRVFGPGHPATLNARSALAWNHGNAGRFNNSLELIKVNYEEIEKSYGAEHPRTLYALGNLASAYEKAGDLENAVKMSEQQLEANRKISGADHPDTLHAINSLASILSNNRVQLSRALQLFHDCYERRLEVLGLKHRDTQATKKNLDFTLTNSLKKSQQWIAEEEWEDARGLLQDMAMYFGPHEAVLPFVQEHLVFCEIGQQKWQAALDLIESFEMDASWGSFESIESSRAACLLNLNRTEDAMEAAQIVLEKKSGFKLSEARATSILAKCLALRDEFKRAGELSIEAAESLDSQLEEMPNYALFLATRALDRCVDVCSLAANLEEASVWQKKLTEIEARINERVQKFSLRKNEEKNN